MLYKLRIIIRILCLRVFHSRGLDVTGIQNIPVCSEIRIKNNGRLLLGDRVAVLGKITISIVGGYLRIGNNTAFNRNCLIVCREKIEIGNSCQFGPNVTIYDHDHCFGEYGIIPEKYNNKAIYIGNNCWVGANVTILKGTHISDYCIIGAGSVVQGFIPKHSIVTSNRSLCIRSINK